MQSRARPLDAAAAGMTMDKLVVMTAEVIRHYGLKQMIGLGVGGGAWVLAAYAARYPQVEPLQPPCMHLPLQRAADDANSGHRGTHCPCRPLHRSMMDDLGSDAGHTCSKGYLLRQRPWAPAGNARLIVVCSLDPFSLMASSNEISGEGATSATGQCSRLTDYAFCKVLPSDP